MKIRAVKSFIKRFLKLPQMNLLLIILFYEIFTQHLLQKIEFSILHKLYN
jgi:hypothetical protein